MTSLNLTPLPATGSSDAGAEAEVTLEDQKQINRFARLNGKEEDLDLVLKGLKRQLDNVKEATDELALADDDEDDELGGDENQGTRDLSNIHFRIGEAFVAVHKDDAEQLLEQKRIELEAEIKSLEAKITPMKEEMSNIKANLYAKFGNNIKLDHDDDDA